MKTEPTNRQTKRNAWIVSALLLAAQAGLRLDAAPVATHRAAPDGFPGAVLVTAEADGEPYFDCVGEAAPGRRMSPDTLFWMASNTKGVVAALALNLVSEGKLSLDDPVEKYFPSWKKLPVKTRPTLRMLLCHTTGLDVFPKKPIARPGMDALAEHVHVEPLKFEPDTDYLYSNWDIDVAAAMMEKATGRPFEVELAERIFKPLGMADSTFIPDASQNARRATFYKLSDKKPPEAAKIVRHKLAPPYLEVGVYPEAGGGLLSTPRDMIKFFQMIARGGVTPDGRRLISAPLMEKWAVKQTPACVKAAYSFGMKVDGKGSLFHGGVGGTWAEVNVKTRKARLYMANMEGSSKAAKAFRSAWMKETVLAPSANIPLPEHPRPDWERPQWVNLNGQWDFGFEKGIYDKKIAVPFGWGSALSGVKDEKGRDTGYYRRAVKVPQTWRGKRVFIVIGAADYETEFSFDGKSLGKHTGGYTPFEFEITDFVKWGEEQAAEFKIWDPDLQTAHKGHYLFGKQGYGNVRGIWQTVYLEARGKDFLDGARFTPSIAKSSVRVELRLAAPAAAPLVAEVTLDGKTAKAPFAKGETAKCVDIAIASPKLWDLDNPNLYSVSIRLGGDEVKTYFGFREVGTGKNANGDPYVTLNGKPVYLQLCLDQSYHPEGYYTFPTDECMKNEMMISKRLALSGNRVHIKVEVPRKLYWADRLGLLIQADVPNAWGPASDAMFAEHWKCFEDMVKRDFNHPSIYQWTLFNETWGLLSKCRGERGAKYEPATQRRVADAYRRAKALDPTRLVDDNSVCLRDHTETDVNTWHRYCPGYDWYSKLERVCTNTYAGSKCNYAPGYAQNGAPMMNAECGNVWGYKGSTGDCDFTWDYHAMINAFRSHLQCGGWLYTEHHDVINEWNGYVRDDRTWKETGLAELAGMTLADFHGEAALTFLGRRGYETGEAVQPGATVKIPVGVSFATDAFAGKTLTLEKSAWWFDGAGRKVSVGPAPVKGAFAAKSWQCEKLWNADFAAPGGPACGCVVFDLMADGRRIARNFWSFTTVATDAAMLKPKASKWSEGTAEVMGGLKLNGFGKGWFEYEIAVPPQGGTFRAELSAKRRNWKNREEPGREIDYVTGKRSAERSKNPNSYPQTSVDKFPANLTVRVGGEVALKRVLPDDPADHRGLLSWLAQPHDRTLREAGSYGWLVEVKVPPEAVKDGKATIRLESDAGLAVYGPRFGRYPLGPGFAPAQMAAVVEPAWPAATKEMRPWAYNWWMGCAADKAGLELQAKQFAEAGMGGYHVIPIYEAKEEKHPKVAFLSEEWTKLFNTADETARAQGLGVDLSMGCGWCFGGPWVSKENGGWHLSRVTGGDKPAKKGARLLWDGNDGQGKRMALYAVPTGTKVKRAPKSGRGLMIDPFSPDAMREHLKPFAAALDRPGAVAPRALYHDSYEYGGASWTPALFEAFKDKRGYDLRDHLPAFAGAGGTKDEQLRVRHDYRETLSDLVLDTFTIWSEWCRKRGITTRNEAHGSPANWLDFYALADIPETEMFNKDRDILVSKFAASAAHVKGTRLVSSESCTWINEHFNASLEEVKVFLDLLFLSGVNHMYYHGSCYSPADAAWPGWCFYATLEMNPRNPIWRDAPILNAWITRVQSLAQTSEPDEDALVYWTLHDYWRNQRELTYGLSVSGKEWFANAAVGKTARRLYADGASFDFVSDRQLAALAKQPKRKWNAIIVPDCETMPVGTARSLAALAKKGYKVVFDGRRPADVPGLKDVEAGRVALAKILAEIPSADVKTAVRREPFNEKAGLAYTRFRRGEDTLYYVVNLSGKATQGAFRPAAETAGAWLLDPMNGKIDGIAVKDGTVELALEKDESVWLWCTPSGWTRSIAVERSAAASVSVALTRPWTLTPVCGGPDMEKGWPRTMRTLASWARHDDGTENPFCGTVRYRTTFTLDGDGARKRATLDLGRVCDSARVRVNGVDAGARIMPPYRVEIPSGALKEGENVLEVEVTNVGANRVRDLDKRKVAWKIFGDINIVGRNYRPFDASSWPLRDAGLFGPVTLSFR